MHLTPELAADLAQVIEYNWADEERDHAEHGDAGNGIFPALIRLRAALPTPDDGDPFTPDRPYNTTLTDSTGARWHFAYWGSGYIYIREHGDDAGPVTSGDNATRDDWPFLIDLNDYGMRPDDVTAEWLAVRATEWITERNADITSGNITT